MKIEKKNSLFRWLIRRERGYKIYPVSYKGKNYIITITNFFERSGWKILDVDKGWIKEKNWVLQVKGYEYPKKNIKNMFPVFNYEITEHVDFSEVAFDPEFKFNTLYIYLYCREIIDYAIKQLEKEKLEEDKKIQREIEQKTWLKTRENAVLEWDGTINPCREEKREGKHDWERNN